MEMDLDKHPSCMLLFKEGSMNKIQMPSDFVKENKKMLAKTCLLKTNVAGMSWEAKLEKEKPNYFICEEDWPQFVVYHKLEIGDFLRFFLVAKSTFHVMLYSQKHGRNLRPFEDLSSSEEEDEDEVEILEEKGKKVEDIEASRKSKKVKVETIDISDSEGRSVEPSPRSKDGGNPCYSHLGVIMKGGKSDAKADNVLGVEKKAPKTKGAKKAAKRRGASYVKRWRSIKDPEKPKRPATSFFVFMEEFRKQFKEKYPNNRSVSAEGIAGGDKWKQFSDAEKAPYVAEAKKRLAEYHKKKDAYIKQVAAGSSEEEESYKSMSEVDEEDGDDD